MDIRAIKDIIQIAQRLDQKGLVNAYEGNISIMRDGFLYITPSGQNKALLREDMISVFDERTGEQVSGMPASSELKMHRAVYKMRDNIGGIVHAHTPFLSAYAMCATPFTSKAHAEFLWDHKSIEVAAYGRPGSDDIYAGVKPILDKGRNVLLLANHGVLAVGKDAFAAMNQLESVENACRICTIAKVVGQEAALPEEEIRTLLSL